MGDGVTGQAIATSTHTHAVIRAIVANDEARTDCSGHVMGPAFFAAIAVGLATLWFFWDKLSAWVREGQQRSTPTTSSPPTAEILRLARLRKFCAPAADSAAEEPRRGREAPVEVETLATPAAHAAPPGVSHTVEEAPAQAMASTVEVLDTTVGAPSASTGVAVPPAAPARPDEDVSSVFLISHSPIGKASTARGHFLLKELPESIHITLEHAAECTDACVNAAKVRGWAGGDLCRYLVHTFDRLQDMRTRSTAGDGPEGPRAAAIALFDRADVALGAALRSELLATAAREPLEATDHPLLSYFGGSEPPLSPPLAAVLFGKQPEDLIVPALTVLQRRMARCTLASADEAVAAALQLCSFAEDGIVAAHMFRHPRWLPRTETPRRLEHDSILGPFFCLSALPSDCPAIAASSFRDALRLMGSPTMSRSMQELRWRLRSVYTQLARLMRLCIRHPDGRPALLRWLGAVVDANFPRGGAVVYDAASMSSDAFLLGVANVGLDVLKPALSQAARNDCAKLGAITAAYCATSDASHVRWERYQRLLAPADADTEEVGTDVALVCQLFWLALGLLHVGPITTWGHHQRLAREVGRMGRQLRSVMELDGLPVEHASPQRQFLEQQLEPLVAAKLCAEVHLLDPELLLTSLGAYATAARWLVFVLFDGKGHGKKGTAKEHTPAFVVEDMAVFTQTVLTLSPESLLPAHMRACLADIALAGAHLASGTVPLALPLRNALLDMLWHMAPLEGNPHHDGLAQPLAIFESNAEALAPPLLQTLCALPVGLPRTEHGTVYEHDGAASSRHLAWTLFCHVIQDTSLEAVLDTTEDPGERSAYAAALLEVSPEAYSAFVTALLADLVFFVGSVLRRVRLLHEASSAQAQAQVHSHLRREARLAHGSARVLRRACALRTVHADDDGHFPSRAARALTYAAVGLSSPMLDDAQRQSAEAMKDVHLASLRGDVVAVFTVLSRRKLLLAWPADGAVRPGPIARLLRSSARAPSDLSRDGRIAHEASRLVRDQGGALEDMGGEGSEDRICPLSLRVMAKPVRAPHRAQVAPMTPSVCACRFVSQIRRSLWMKQQPVSLSARMQLTRSQGCSQVRTKWSTTPRSQPQPWLRVDPF